MKKKSILLIEVSISYLLQNFKLQMKKKKKKKKKDNF